MKLEILLSCMYQKDASLVFESRIVGNVVIINQCDKEAYMQYSTRHGIAKMYSTKQRGLTKSRNMAIEKSEADVCLLCDDDEKFVEDYENKILQAYEEIPMADIVVFKMKNRSPSFKDKVMLLKFPATLKVSSWQISFRRESLIRTGVRFDELLGAGTGSGAEEELKFLIDCQKAGLRIYYVPIEIASVEQKESTWFEGFTEQFFYNRGSTTRYILGGFLSSVYAVYYIIKKRKQYQKWITMKRAFVAIFKGIREDKITKKV